LPAPHDGAARSGGDEGQDEHAGDHADFVYSG
jgi:hypothetical protein